MTQTPNAGTNSGRLISLDAFRGLTIMLMILVNNPGDWGNIYTPLKHADWHGCTPTDLVFPFFLFIVGVAICLALSKRKLSGDRRTIVLHVLRRSAILFGLGLFLSGFGLLFRLGPDYGFGDLLTNLRIPGVLQRIAVCYCVASLLYLFALRKILYGVTIAALLGYWALMMWVPVPEHGPGKIDDKDTHLAAYLDRAVLGTNHLWSAARTWDPEGILSTLPALATTLLGIFTGCWLRRELPLAKKLVGLLTAGVLLVLLGWMWGSVFPINKPIWTSSYVLFTAGWALLVLGLCVLLFDMLRWQPLAQPLVIYGVNAITVFVLSGVVARLLAVIKIGGEESISLKTWLYDNLFLSWLTGENASLAYAVVWCLAWLVVLTFMYRRNWIIKV